MIKEASFSSLSDSSVFLPDISRSEEYGVLLRLKGGFQGVKEEFLCASELFCV
jgi:hypothetical protein